MKRFFSRLFRFRIAPAQLDKPTSDLLAHYAALIRAIEAQKVTPEKALQLQPTISDGKLTAAEAADGTLGSSPIV